MMNFDVKFENPLWLLLLIPAVLLTVIPYFRMQKRYRGTRNRITSMVLHGIIMLIAIAVMAGLTLEYDLPNKENEVILLVDVSQSGEMDAEQLQQKDDFVKAVIDSSDAKYKLGIVTFGFDQVYAVELNDDTDDMYAAYLQAQKPDQTATDIASALRYAAGIFTNPQAARIVLISDAVETDSEAAAVIKSIAAQGIKVDTVYFPQAAVGNEVQIVEMLTPDEKIMVGEPFIATLTLQSSVAGTVELTPYDNGTKGEAISVELEEGVQSLEVPFTFQVPGLHKLTFELTGGSDNLQQNNRLTSYVHLEIFDDILIIESISGESDQLRSMMREELNVTVVNVNDAQKMPTTLHQLRAYDEVILCNISYDDMPLGFEDILYEYVHEIGGGLFTICGNEEDPNPYDDNWTPNAYTREDMLNSKYYRNMLPVDIIEYTPPVGVVIIIDRSGSMYDPSSGPEAGSKLGAAKEGAKACLDALTERDYVGIMSMGDEDKEAIEITPRPEYGKIVEAIDAIQGGGATILSDALEVAGRKLRALSSVERRHIIIVTDGEFDAADKERYEAAFKENAKYGITTSIVGIQVSSGIQSKMKIILEEFAGCKAENFHAVVDVSKIGTVMRKDLEVPEIKEVQYKKFQPTITGLNAVTTGVVAADIPTLDGFYGVKLKDGAQAILMGEFTPIYAQWKYGKGRVGTFACDLNGTFSRDFVSNATGQTLINNMITALFPTESVRSPDIEMEAEGKNYKTNLSVFTELEEGQYVEVTITSPGVNGEDGEVQVLTAGANETYSRLTFAVKTSGVHTIRAVKKDASGTQVGQETEIYKALSYSQEYNVFTDPEVAEALMEKLAADGHGVVIEDANQVFENAVKYIHHVIDPRIPLIITALVLFLLDIAVRKFKWKWPHELIRERKARKATAK